MENKDIMYAYIKNSRYKEYSVVFEGNDEIEQIRRTFDTLEDMLHFATQFSNYYSIPIQFYI